MAAILYLPVLKCKHMYVFYNEPHRTHTASPYNTQPDLPYKKFRHHNQHQL